MSTRRWRLCRCLCARERSFRSAPEMNYVGEKPFDPITFTIYPDEKGSAASHLVRG